MKEQIDRFFASGAFAVAGVSRNSKKFGNAVFRAMKDRNMKVHPVNPHLETLEGQRCFANVRDLPEEVQSILIVVHPNEAAQIVAACKEKGIRNIWLQRGAESGEAINYANLNGLNIVHGQCILMFLEPVKGFHAFHRWVNQLTPAYPR